MSRRRLLTVYTSDDDDEDVPQQPQYANPNPNPNPNPNIELYEQLQQSPPQQQPNDNQDVFFDDAMDAEEEDIEIPSPISIPNIDSITLNSSHTTTATTTTTTTTVSEQPSVVLSDDDFVDVSDNLSPPQVATTSFVSSGCPVNDHLKKLGLNLRREWLDSCKLGLQNSVVGFSNFDVETKAKLCFGQFLYSDMNYIGAGLLPQNVHALHLVDLAGPFVLQVDEVVNISCPLRDRYKNAPAGLKRCLKLSMTDGVQRVFGMEYRPIKSLEALASAGFKVAIWNVNVRRGLLMLVPEVLEILGGYVEELEAARQRLVLEVNKPPKGKRTRSGIVPPLSTRATLAAWAQNGVNNAEMPPNDVNNVRGNTLNSGANSATHLRESISGVDLVNRNRPAPHSGIVITDLPTSGRADLHSSSRESGENCSSRETAQLYSNVGADLLPMNGKVVEPLHGRESALRSFPTSTKASTREHAEFNPLSATVIENEDTHMVDYTDHPFISNGEDFPFNYLSRLSAKWAAVQGHEPSVKGKIKCFLTGVKKFSYKRSAFELLVHVDDGSLITRLFVHHNAVQKVIGYSPEEVTAALSSSDEVVFTNMKNTLKQFQIFLINFEGTMLVEFNRDSPFPVALEMSQGCPASDPWLLLQRLKPDTSRPVSQHGQSDVITLSP